MTENKPPISMEGQSSTPGHGPTQLRLRAFEPRRRRKLTIASELRSFLFVLLLVLILMIATLSATADPIGTALHFLGLILPL